MPIVGTNSAALNATFFLNIADAGLSKSIKRLSSGSKLADPADDPAGVAVGGKFDASVKRLTAAAEGAQNLISFAQTADGFLSVIQQQLVRMSELAARATNGAFSSSDRANYSYEFGKLVTNITNQVTNAKFNGSNLFGTSGTVGSIVSQDGTNRYEIALRNLNDSVVNSTSSGSLYGMADMSISTISGASAAITTLSTLLGNVARDRAYVNADVAALNFYVDTLSTEKINVQAANSRIQDLEFAEESTTLAKYNILTQSATAMLTQANTSQQVVLGLLR